MSDDLLLCLPATIDPSLLLGLSQAGYRLEQIDAENLDTSPKQLLAALVSARNGLSVGLDTCRKVRASAEGTVPILLLVNQVDVSSLDHTGEVFDDFAILPTSAAELIVRLSKLTVGRGAAAKGVLVTFGPLKINTETYQAAIDGRVLDLTYMEYELLTFLASNPTKVFTREALLSRVWGYEYYGGARTVDVHIRRLRAKLGEEHASLIETIRSVGYRLGQPSWAT